MSENDETTWLYAISRQAREVFHELHALEKSGQGDGEEATVLRRRHEALLAEENQLWLAHNTPEDGELVVSFDHLN